MSFLANKTVELWGKRAQMSEGSVMVIVAVSCALDHIDGEPTAAQQHMLEWALGQTSLGNLSENEAIDLIDKIESIGLTVCPPELDAIADILPV